MSDDVDDVLVVREDVLDKAIKAKGAELHRVFCTFQDQLNHMGLSDDYVPQRLRDAATFASRAMDKAREACWRDYPLDRFQSALWREDQAWASELIAEEEE